MTTMMITTMMMILMMMITTMMMILTMLMLIFLLFIMESWKNLWWLKRAALDIQSRRKASACRVTRAGQKKSKNHYHDEEEEDFTQWPVSHGLEQNFDGGAGYRCPVVFSTGYGAHQGKKTGVLDAHAFFVLGTVPIKKKRLQIKPQANKHYKEALEQCNHNNHVSKFI